MLKCSYLTCTTLEQKSSVSNYFDDNISETLTSSAKFLIELSLFG